MRRFVRIAARSAAVALLAAPAWSQVIQVDKKIPAYKKTSGVSGSVNSIGSDTLNNVMTFWAEGFRKQYPNVKIQIEGKGSSTAPPALIAGTAQLGPMSRLMKPTEIDEFEKKYGYKPTPLRVAVDGLAIFVNKDNPLQKITLPQVDAIFSSTRKGGHPADILTWGGLGLKGEWSAKPISLFGRNSASGTYGYFKEHALYKGDFRDKVKEQPGSASVVQGVTEDRFAIGYSGVGYQTSGVRALQLAEKEGAPYVDDSPENVLSGKYPLSRYLYVYINAPPGKPLDPLVREFLKYVLSKDGQEIVVKDGYIPIPAHVQHEEVEKL